MCIYIYIYVFISTIHNILSYQLYQPSRVRDDRRCGAPSLYYKMVKPESTMNEVHGIPRCPHVFWVFIPKTMGIVS